MTSPTDPLLSLDLFKEDGTRLTEDENLSLTYERARAIARAYRISANDVLNLTPKFWQLHRDPINLLDLSSMSLLTIQYNLAAGVLALHAKEQPTHRALLGLVLNFDVSAQFMLTEVAHGLDARNLETTATLLADGSFDLHTPNPSAAKIMPPARPIKGFPRVAVVFAQLIVSGESRGLRPFLVWLNDGERMSKGISTLVLPPRAGPLNLDHAVTTFTHVPLPSTALLGSLSKPRDVRADFLSQIHRVAIGGVAIPLILIEILKMAAFVAGRYSLRRHVGSGSASQAPVPIISFRTQQRPILHTLAQTAVLDAYATELTQTFQNGAHPKPVLDGMGAAFKAVITQACRRNMPVLSERCGAQGLYVHNQIIALELQARGGMIAEGDSLVLCIRLANELLLNRYSLPPPRNPLSLLALHEQGLFTECRRIITTASDTNKQRRKNEHRGSELNSLILPRCEALVQAIGHRMAYEAAVDAGVAPQLLALYESAIVGLDSAWFVEYADYSRDDQFQDERAALDAVLPRLGDLLEATGVAKYCTAPIVEGERWEGFVGGLEAKL